MSGTLKKQAEEFQSLLEQTRKVLISTHLRPDGDAIGSALGLALALEQLGKEVIVVSNDSPPKNLHFLPTIDRIFVPGSDDFTVACDMAVVVDVNYGPRLGSARQSVGEAPIRVVIDHHVLGEEKIEGFQIVHPDYAACALLLFDLFSLMNVRITLEIGQCLLTGIVTDTGNFRFQNTDSRCLSVSSDLLALGCDLRVITESVFDRKPLASIRMLARALSKMELIEDGSIVVSHLAVSDYEEVGVLDELTESIVNEIGRVDTALVSALFREPEPGKVRASVRSRGDVDVAEVCRQFSGGGHRNAAGCTFDADIESAMAQLVPALRDAVRKHTK